MGLIDPLRNAPATVFSTCPPYTEDEGHLRHVARVARWSEEWGCEGILVYTDNGQLDPWIVSHCIIANTATLSPLVAVQPVYMHPYTVAKTVATLGSLYTRRLYLNMVAGGFRRDLLALGDETPHDRRYERLVEYSSIIRDLLAGQEPVSLSGRHYTVDTLKLAPSLPAELRPGFLVSGSSEAGIAAAEAIGATAIRYPEPADEEDPPPQSVPHGIRVGIIARPDEEEAWATARARFPEDRRGQLAHQLAMKVTDSSWHQALSEQARRQVPDSPYWLVPFENYKTFCPYLVGSYETVATELRRFLDAGCSTIILDVPSCEADLEHTACAFSAATLSMAS